MGRFCSMHFNSLELSPDGTCQVCCKIERVIHKEDGSKFNLVTDSIADVWESKDLKALRAKFLEGVEPEECSKCWIEESNGNHSLRQQTQHNTYSTTTPYPNYVSLKLSNKCNLACRICGPHLSSLWENEFSKTARDTGDPDYFKAWTPAFKHVLIYGGEPLINHEVLSFLSYCSREGLASNIHLVLNTNGTICNERVLHQLSQFKHVSLFLSIDDVGSRFEYQRWPAKWDKIKENITRFSDLGEPFEVKFYPTFSLFNIFYMKEILDQLTPFGIPINLTNIIHQPDVFSLNNLPPIVKNELVASIKSVPFSNYYLDGDLDYKNIFINSIQMPPAPRFAQPLQWYRDFRHHLEASDKHRHQSFDDSFTYLSRLINKAVAVSL